MKPQVKEYFKLSIIYTALGAIPAVLGVIIQPIIEGPDLLDVEQFAYMSIADSVSGLAFTFGLFAINGAIARFYYDYEENSDGYKTLVASIYNSILMRGAILLGVVLLSGDFFGQFFTSPETRDFSRYGYLVVLTGIARAVQFTASAQYRNEKKLSNFIWLSLGMGFVRAGFQVLGLFFYEMSFVGFFMGGCIGNWLVSGAILIYTYWQTGLRHDFKLMRSVNSYAAPLFLFGLVEWGILFIDRYFLEADPHELGIYDTALKFGFGLSLIVIALNNAMKPEIFRLIQKGVDENEGEIRTLSNLLMAQVQLLVAAAIIPTILYLMLYETDLRLASAIVAIVFMRYVLRGQFMVFSTPLYYNKNTIALFYINAAALAVIILLNWLLIPTMGFYGAITAILVSQGVTNILSYYYQQKVMHINWNITKLVVQPVLIVLLAVVLEIFKYFLGLNVYIAAGIIVVAILVTTWMLYRQDLKKLPIIGNLTP